MSEFTLPFPIDSISSHFGPRLINPETGELIPLWGDQLALSRGVWEEHMAIDYRQNAGTPILCPADGVVSRVTDGDDSEGYAVYISHGENSAVLSVCAHLSGRPDLEKGQAVSRGQIIGYVGDSGNSTGPHCHFGVLIRGIPYNPLTVAANWGYYLSVDWDSTERETDASNHPQ